MLGELLRINYCAFSWVSLCRFPYFIILFLFVELLLPSDIRGKKINIYKFGTIRVQINFETSLLFTLKVRIFVGGFVTTKRYGNVTMHGQE